MMANPLKKKQSVLKQNREILVVCYPTVIVSLMSAGRWGVVYSRDWPGGSMQRKGVQQK